MVMNYSLDTTEPKAITAAIAALLRRMAQGDESSARIFASKREKDKYSYAVCRLQEAAGLIERIQFGAPELGKPAVSLKYPSLGISEAENIGSNFPGGRFTIGELDKPSGEDADDGSGPS